MKLPEALHSGSLGHLSRYSRPGALLPSALLPYPSDLVPLCSSALTLATAHGLLGHDSGAHQPCWELRFMHQKLLNYNRALDRKLGHSGS